MGKYVHISSIYHVKIRASMDWHTKKEPDERQLEKIKQAVERVLLKAKDTEHDWLVWFQVDKVYATRYDEEPVRVMPVPCLSVQGAIQ